MSSDRHSHHRTMSHTGALWHVFQNSNSATTTAPINQPYIEKKNVRLSWGGVISLARPLWARRQT